MEGSYFSRGQFRITTARSSWVFLASITVNQMLLAIVCSFVVHLLHRIVLGKSTQKLGSLTGTRQSQLTSRVVVLSQQYC